MLCWVSNLKRKRNLTHLYVEPCPKQKYHIIMQSRCACKILLLTLFYSVLLKYIILVYLLELLSASSQNVWHKVFETFIIFDVIVVDEGAPNIRRCHRKQLQNNHVRMSVKSFQCTRTIPDSHA